MPGILMDVEHWRIGFPAPCDFRKSQIKLDGTMPPGAFTLESISLSNLLLRG